MVDASDWLKHLSTFFITYFLFEYLSKNFNFRINEHSKNAKVMLMVGTAFGVFSGFLMAFASKLESRMEKRGAFADNSEFFELAQTSSRKMEITRWISCIALGVYKGITS
jgi:hypothetical protein